MMLQVIFNILLLTKNNIFTTLRFLVYDLIRYVDAVEYFLLPLPGAYKVSRFQVCLRFQFLSSKCFRFHKNLTASTSLPHVL